MPVAPLQGVRQAVIVWKICGEASVLLKVSETPSLKLAPGASVLPDVDVVDGEPDVPPHATRIVATTTSAPNARRRLANFAFMVLSSRVSESDSRIFSS
jgi:hypothetical protein